jgi:hypothetical protein
MAKTPGAASPKVASWVKMLFFFGFLLVLAYSALVAFNPQAHEWATAEDGPTPFHFANQILALPAHLIGPTKKVVARNDGRADPFGPLPTAPGPSSNSTVAAPDDSNKQASHVTLPVSETKNLTATAPLEPAPDQPAAEAPPAAVPDELKLPGGVVVTNRSTAGTPAASASFMYWVASLTVSGVTSTSPARFLMNGRLVREGEEAGKQLGITFDHVDAAAKLLYFRDKSGAIVTRSY